MGLSTSRSPVERNHMTASERADSIIKDAREKFLVGGQLALFLRNRIIEEIIKAEKDTVMRFSSISTKQTKY